MKVNETAWTNLKKQIEMHLADAATVHPSFANFIAKALPIPLLAPVIQITFFSFIIQCIIRIC